MREGEKVMSGKPNKSRDRIFVGKHASSGRHSFQQPFKTAARNIFRQPLDAGSAARQAMRSESLKHEPLAKLFCSKVPKK